MSSVESKVERLEGTVSEIKLEMVSISHTIADQATILKELKEVIVNQNKTLANVFEVKAKVGNLEEELKELQDDYKIRKDKTDVFIKEGQDFMSKFSGATKAIGVCFVLIQSIVGFNIMNASNALDKNTQDLRKVEMEVAASKAKSEYIKETLDKLIIEEKKNHTK